MTHHHLTTYRIIRRCTVRARPAPQGAPIARVGVGSTFTGMPVEQAPGWVEQVRDGECAGYLRASCVEPLAERTV